MKKFSKVQKLIIKECEDIKELLLEKNKSYGNSATSRLKIFSKSKNDEAIRVRIDDKLSRIARGKKYKDESTIEDLIGYLILLRVCKKLKKK